MFIPTCFLRTITFITTFIVLWPICLRPHFNKNLITSCEHIWICYCNSGCTTRRFCCCNCCNLTNFSCSSTVFFVGASKINSLTNYRWRIINRAITCNYVLTIKYVRNCFNISICACSKNNCLTFSKNFCIWNCYICTSDCSNCYVIWTTKNSKVNCISIYLMNPKTLILMLFHLIIVLSGIICGVIKNSNPFTRSKISSTRHCEWCWTFSLVWW